MFGFAFRMFLQHVLCLLRVHKRGTLTITRSSTQIIGNWSVHGIDLAGAYGLQVSLHCNRALVEIPMDWRLLLVCCSKGLCCLEVLISFLFVRRLPYSDRTYAPRGQLSSTHATPNPKP